MAADYYSALIRVVSNLEGNTPQARQNLYDHARSTIVGQLRRRNPHTSAQEITEERAALEIAIERVEADSVSNQIDMPLPHSEDVGTRVGQLNKAEEAVEATPAVPVKSPSPPPGFDMAAMPERLGTMLIGIAVAVSLLVFAGLMYVTRR
jgi:hypothetical protein